MNRINLLKKEEEKTAKRIEDTKKKTDRVIDMKRRNQEMNLQVRLLGKKQKILWMKKEKVKRRSLERISFKTLRLHKEGRNGTEREREREDLSE